MLFLLDFLIFLDDIICLIDAKFAGFGEVGDGEFGIVEEELEEASIEVGFGKGVILAEHLGEAIDGLVEVARLGIAVCFFKGGDGAHPAERAHI